MNLRLKISQYSSQHKHGLKILVGVMAYVIIGQLTHYICNPMLPRASLALNMVVPVVMGYWDGSLTGLVVGALGTLLNFLVKLPFYGIDGFEFLAILPHALMGGVAGWKGLRGMRVGTALTVLIGHALNMLAYLLAGLVSMDTLQDFEFWLGLTAEIMVTLIFIVLAITLLERLKGRDVGFSWQYLGWPRFVLLVVLNLSLIVFLLIGYRRNILFVDYLLILSIVLVALTVGFIEAWICALFVSIWVGRVIVREGLPVRTREVLLILVLNAVALVIGDVVSNLRRHRRLNRLRLSELQEAYAVLTQTDHLKDQMIQNISHELRTPLSMILGYTELLTTGAWGRLTVEQQEAARVVRRNAHRLSHIVEKVTVLERVDQGQATRHPTSLVSLAQNLINSWQKKALTDPSRLKLNVRGEVPPVNGDASYLKLAIEALLDNAIKFSPDGGVITSRIWADDGKVYFAVEDRGIGISKEDQASLFKPFYQVDGTTTRRFEGLGTGLALVKEVARIHGGDVWVESEKGHGSTFGFWVPAGRVASPWKDRVSGDETPQ